MHLQYGALCLTQVKLRFCLSSSFGLPQRLTELCCSFSQNGSCAEGCGGKVSWQGEVVHNFCDSLSTAPLGCDLSQHLSVYFWCYFLGESMELNAFFNIRFIQTVVNCSSWRMVKQFLLCPKAPGMCLLFYYLYQKHEFMRRFSFVFYSGKLITFSR